MRPQKKAQSEFVHTFRIQAFPAKNTIYVAPVVLEHANVTHAMWGREVGQALSLVSTHSQIKYLSHCQERFTSDGAES